MESAPRSIPPPSIIPPGEEHLLARADDGTRLFVRTRGGGGDDRAPLVIFCDGILCDGFIWKYLWDDLAAHGPVAHWHYRGHGRSGAPVDADRVDIEAHARDLMAVRRLLGDPPCVLVGHSMGVQVALETYHLFPEKVLGLVLACGSYGKVTSSFRGLPVLDLVLPKLMEVVDRKPSLVRALWSRVPAELSIRLALLSRDVDPDRIRRDDMLPYMQHMTHVDFPLFLRMLRAAGEHTAEPYLQSVAVPTLVIAGERDTFTPAWLSERLAREIPDAELVTLAGGSHAAPIEQPDVTREKIVAFLDRLRP